MINRLFQRFINRLKQVRTNQMMSEEIAEVGCKRTLQNPSTAEETIKKAKVDSQNAQDDDVKVKPPKRKKIALLTVYSGKGYHGVQIQTQQGFTTIESELVKALHKADLIGQEHVDEMRKMWFQRASRTDKGVSAAGQVFSLLMRMDIENPVEMINSSLPDNIRVIAAKKTTKGFDAKNSCSHRTYEYLTPTFAFTPVDQEATTEDFRINDDLVKRINEVMQYFKGTHNFHNFTSRKKYNDRSATRYMMSFEAGNPFVLDGIEFLVITVKGQSFMLHQIRKMIGLTMAVVKGYASVDTIELCWGPSKVDIPKAPGLGLLLDKLYYDGYNKRFGSDGVHEPIDWSQYKDKIEKFKMDHIYADIMRTEKEERGMWEWLQSMHLHSYQTYDPTTVITADKSEDEGEAEQLQTPNSQQLSLDKTPKESDKSIAEKLISTVAAGDSSATAHQDSINT